MDYLIKTVFTKRKYMKRKLVAHLWDGEDTMCKMASTGGLNVKYFDVFDEAKGCDVCKNCINVMELERVNNLMS